MVNFASKVLAVKRFSLVDEDVAVVAKGVLFSLVERLLVQLNKVLKLCSDPWLIINVSLVVLNRHDVIHTNLDYIKKHDQTNLAVIAINWGPVNQREIAFGFQLSTWWCVWP